MSYPYNFKDVKWAWIPEISYGKIDSGKSQWAANVAGDTFYAMPIFMDPSPNFDWLRQEKMFEKRWSGGSHYYQSISNNGYKPINFTFTGSVLNRSLFMYFGTDVCANTGSGPYTHQHDKGDTYPAVPPTFTMIRYGVNADSGESKYDLYMGCILKEYRENGTINSNIRGTYIIEASRHVAGVELTSFPSQDPNHIFYTGDSVLTWTNAAVNYAGIVKGFDFIYKTDKRLGKGLGDYYPLLAYMANKRDTYLTIDFEPFETDTYDDSQDSPISDANKDVVLKSSRNTSTDYFQITFSDVFQQLQSAVINPEQHIQERHQLDFNFYDAGSTYDLTEVNSFTENRYKANV